MCDGTEFGRSLQPNKTVAMVELLNERFKIHLLG
jgi:hypothetical protein